MSLTEDPAVIAWRIALAGDRRPTPPPRRHWWRELVVEAWRAADDAWLMRREAYAVGYRAEMAEFAHLNPRPTLGEFMRHLASGRLDPYELAP